MNKLSRSCCVGPDPRAPSPRTPDPRRGKPCRTLTALAGGKQVPGRVLADLGLDAPS
jgi:hypothetical protein